MKKLKKYISILNEGHFSYNHLWAKLQMVDIDSHCYIDNGFITCEVDALDSDRVMSIVKEYLGERLTVMFGHDSEDSAKLGRTIYWKQK